MSRRRPRRFNDRETARWSHTPDPMPATCWRCDAPALTGRAVCQDCAENLELRAARIRSQATRGKTNA